MDFGFGKDIGKNAGQTATDKFSEIVEKASKDLDEKLDRISNELSRQRQLTKDDVKELMIEASELIGKIIDARVDYGKKELSGLFQEKLDDLQQRVDTFFKERKDDIARERNRLLKNLLISVCVSILMAFVAYYYQKTTYGTINVLTAFRICFGSLAGGYFVYIISKAITTYIKLPDYKKDLVFAVHRYWGVLRPQSLVAHIIVLFLIVIIYLTIFHLIDIRNVMNGLMKY